MKFSYRSALPLCLLLLSTACSKSNAVGGPSDGGDGGAVGNGGDGDGDGTESALAVELFNVATNATDPRFESLPASLSRAELGPNRTLRAVVDATVGSVSFSIGGGTIVDSAAPFLMSGENPLEAGAWSRTAGDYEVTVQSFASADGSGEPLASQVVNISITGAGLDETPDDGEHTQHRYWITKSGKYVTQNDAGDFVGLDGATVLAATDVELQEATASEGEYVTTTPGAEEIDFAFIALLPEGYDPAVKYPLFVFLHHGWNIFRGTDNDGDTLDNLQVFSGARSIYKSATRNDYPAVILVPQMKPVEVIDGVTHEWAAFTAIDNNKGDFARADEPSQNAEHTFSIIDDLLDGTLPIGGGAVGVDSGRVYLGGHSMGGLGTWDFLTRRPEFFAAAFPMAGYPDHESASLLTEMPIWAFHHQDDCSNPYAGTETMHALITGEPNNGTKMRFTTLDFVASNCTLAHNNTPSPVWNSEPEIFDWIFSQARAR